jgi:hypothetical protein
MRGLAAAGNLLPGQPRACIGGRLSGGEVRRCESARSNRDHCLNPYGLGGDTTSAIHGVLLPEARRQHSGLTLTGEHDLLRRLTALTVSCAQEC